MTLLIAHAEFIFNLCKSNRIELDLVILLRFWHNLVTFGKQVPNYWQSNVLNIKSECIVLAQRNLNVESTQIESDALLLSVARIVSKRSSILHTNAIYTVNANVSLRDTLNIYNSNYHSRY